MAKIQQFREFQQLLGYSLNCVSSFNWLISKICTAVDHYLAGLHTNNKPNLNKITALCTSKVSTHKKREIYQIFQITDS